MKHYLGLILVVLLGCTNSKNLTTKPNQPTKLKQGFWRLSLDIGNGKELPFNFNYENGLITILNADEMFKVSNVKFVNDSIYITMPLFNSRFDGKISDQNSFSGVWRNFSKGKNYAIPFKAEKDVNYRFFEKSLKYNQNPTGKWEVTFDDDYKAIGLFELQKDNIITGTFITETGDYRYLEGNLKQDSLFLSCFDGSHAFRFSGKINGDKISGDFNSGNHYSDTWTAVKNDNFTLTNPNELTYIKDGYEGIVFSLPDLDSNIVTFPSKRFENKVTIIQIMGSWCPNCMDETKFLSGIYEKYKDEDLEIVSVAFETPKTFGGAVKSITKIKNHFSCGYTFLYGGSASKTKANDVFPMLNHVMSFPTCILIGKDGKVKKIHTGFYGPGTGEYYENYTKEFVAMLEGMF